MPTTTATTTAADAVIPAYRCSQPAAHRAARLVGRRAHLAHERPRQPDQERKRHDERRDLPSDRSAYPLGLNAAVLRHRRIRQQHVDEVEEQHHPGNHGRIEGREGHQLQERLAGAADIRRRRHGDVERLRRQRPGHRRRREQYAQIGSISGVCRAELT